MSERSITGDVAVKLLKEFPNTPTRALARLAYRENPEVYKDTEHARSTLRYYRGSLGDDLRDRRKGEADDELMEQEPRDPTDFPESDAKDHFPFIIDDDLKRGLILSDIHIPFHDVEAVKLALNYGRDKDCDWIILNGDFLDFYSLSYFIRDPRKRRFSEELDMCKEALEYIRNMFPDAKIYYKTGNHEERYEKYMYTKAPELVGVEQYKIEHLLGLDEFGAEIIKDKRIAKYRGLNIIHGHELYSSLWNPVNPARGLFLKSKTTGICGHHHRTSEHIEPDMNDKITACWSTGCLCHLKPEYSPHNRWNHGFAYIAAQGEHSYALDNIKIIDYEIV